MIRKAIIAVSIALTAMTLAAGAMSYWRDIGWRNKASAECPLVCITIADGKLWLFSMKRAESPVRQTVSEADFLGFAWERMVQPRMRVADATGRLQTVRNVCCLSC